MSDKFNNMAVDLATQLWELTPLDPKFPEKFTGTLAAALRKLDAEARAEEREALLARLREDLSQYDEDGDCAATIRDVIGFVNRRAHVRNSGGR